MSKVSCELLSRWMCLLYVSGDVLYFTCINVTVLIRLFSNFFVGYASSSFGLTIFLVVLQVVALVCNFAGSRSSSSAKLNHWEVETLFHEFGHALHSLLSRTVFY